MVLEVRPDNFAVREREVEVPRRRHRAEGGRFDAAGMERAHYRAEAAIRRQRQWRWHGEGRRHASHVGASRPAGITPDESAAAVTAQAESTDASSGGSAHVRW
jgi:hypothetical protein